ncbi:hypothetical protein PILCRDRAFT_664484 [Piloderma croceum F 1598]|uniref:Uncharacterized protein n=1 Tax=Piloderma croceum (strain F 1598) TaxID=765440 RepID=A0A0C3F7F9_PILCF|nr:hypothetical protein PILCRDRAFT_664484 [Piloderma croceum F 1598]
MARFSVLVNNTWYTGDKVEGTSVSLVNQGPPETFAIDLKFANQAQEQFHVTAKEFKQVDDSKPLTNSPG